MDASILELLKNVDVQTVDPETLVDIRDVITDPELPKDEYDRNYIEKVKNPYCYKCGKMIIKLNYADTDKTMTDRLMDFFAGRGGLGKINNQRK